MSEQTEVNPEHTAMTIGAYRILLSKITPGKYWICHKSGEGTEVDGKKLEKLIHDFFEENM